MPDHVGLWVGKGVLSQDFPSRLRSRVWWVGIMQVIILAYQRSYDISDPFSFGF
jgi:hypothetical protein